MSLNEVIKWLGWISVFGGVIGGATLGYDKYAEEMIWSIMLPWAVSGVVSGVLLFAVVRALELLEEIASNTKAAAKTLDKPPAARVASGGSASVERT